MTLPNGWLAEIEVLFQFSGDSIREGIKIHHDAKPELIAAAKRLHEKGLVTQDDGGYLTSLGIDAVEHVHALGLILTEQ
jgi:uncharacterized protein (TIGR02647 family)